MTVVPTTLALDIFFPVLDSVGHRIKLKLSVAVFFLLTSVDCLKNILGDLGEIPYFMQSIFLLQEKFKVTWPVWGQRALEDTEIRSDSF